MDACLHGFVLHSSATVPVMGWPFLTGSDNSTVPDQECSQGYIPVFECTGCRVGVKEPFFASAVSHLVEVQGCGKIRSANGGSEFQARRYPKKLTSEPGRP
jgi:hypothetical protein